MRKLAAAFFLLAAPLLADTDWAFHGLTESQLPGACDPGRLYNIVDGADAEDCDTGLGSTAVSCQCNNAGNGYVAVQKTIAHDHADAAGGGDVALATGSTGFTHAADDNDTSIATTAFVQQEIDDPITKTMCWTPWSVSADGTQCNDPDDSTTIGSWGKMATIVCTNNNASTMTGTIPFPQGWNAGTLVFHLTVIQDAADTSEYDADVAARCVGDTETPPAYGTEQALDDTMTGSDAKNTMTSAAVTAAGTCAAGDLLQWQIQVSTDTTTAMATLHHVAVCIEYTSTPGD